MSGRTEIQIALYLYHTVPHIREGSGTPLSTLAWKIPWTREPGRLQSMESLWVGHSWVTSLSLFTFHALEEEMSTHSSVLAWRIPGMREPGGLLSVRSHRVGHDWNDLAAAAAVPHIFHGQTRFWRKKNKLEVIGWQVEVTTVLRDYKFW